jgi:hypothetical protein
MPALTKLESEVREMATLNIAQMQTVAATFGNDAAFVANVIATQHRNRARKLRGLLGLLKAGLSVRVAAFNLDVLVVDGRRETWAFLETTIARFPHNHPEYFVEEVRQ